MIRLLFLLLSVLTVVSSGYDSSWTATGARDYPRIAWDLEGSPLQIKTDSTLGSGDVIQIAVWAADNSYMTFISLNFSDPMQYYLQYCTHDLKDLPVQPPVEVDKVWTFTKTDTAFIIKCNEVEVLNYLYSDAFNSACGTEARYGGDIVEMGFAGADTASDFYRAAPVGMDL